MLRIVQQEIRKGKIGAACDALGLAVLSKFLDSVILIQATTLHAVNNLFNYKTNYSSLPSLSRFPNYYSSHYLRLPTRLIKKPLFAYFGLSRNPLQQRCIREYARWNCNRTPRFPINLRNMSTSSAEHARARHRLYHHCTDDSLGLQDLIISFRPGFIEYPRFRSFHSTPELLRYTWRKRCQHPKKERDRLYCRCGGR